MPHTRERASTPTDDSSSSSAARPARHIASTHTSGSCSARPITLVGLRPWLTAPRPTISRWVASYTMALVLCVPVSIPR
eukprot:scaffold77397_cov61-Phaeocystis_antarctica.AAC.9